MAYGGSYMGFTNTFTIWGDSNEIQFDDKGNPKYTATGAGTVASPKIITAYSTKPVPAFTTSKQLGLANKFELYKGENWTFNNGLAYFKNKLQDKASYAIDFGVTKDGTIWEYWLDAIYGFTSKAPYESYGTFRKNEYFVQTGAQYHLNEIWSVLTNLEYLHVKDQAFTYSNLDKAGATVVSSSYKIELGTQYKLSKSSFITTGVLYEKKIAAKNGVDNLTSIKGMTNANAEGYQFLSSISFWF